MQEDNKTEERLESELEECRTSRAADDSQRRYYGLNLHYNNVKLVCGYNGPLLCASLPFQREKIRSARRATPLIL